MKRVIMLFLFLSFVSNTFAQNQPVTVRKIRRVTDTLGFAHLSWQMDSVYSRVQRMQGNMLRDAFEKANVGEETIWKVAVCPHDDYTYAGYMYPLSLYNIQAKTLIMFGVCHKAMQFGVENKLIFDSYSHWQGPYGPVKVSSLRDEIIKNLPSGIAVVNDSIHQAEHSLEALIPYLQYYNNDIEIIPILVPYMTINKIDIFSKLVGQSVKLFTGWYKMKWGEDFAIIISSDAVHYGDEDWGGKEYDRYGVDREGYLSAKSHEEEIINNTLTGEIRPDKIRRLSSYLVDDNDDKEYKWSWCGRYSLPFGLWTALNIAKIMGIQLQGTCLGYSTSIENKPLKVDDLHMGITAPASLRHWVGYVSMGYQ